MPKWNKEQPRTQPTCPVGQLLYDAAMRLDIGTLEVVREVNRRGKSQGINYTRTAWAKWMTGTIPRPDARRLLGDVLEIPHETLANVAAQQERDRFAASAATANGARYPEGVSAARTLAGLGLEPDDVPSLEDIQTAVVRLRRSYSTTAPLELRRRIDERLRQVRSLLSRNERPSWQSDLTEAASWLVLLRGTVLADLRQYEAAQTAVLAARDLAREVGHRELEAWTWETAAWMATTDGRHCDARELASAGVEVAPGGSHGLVAVTLQRARINATLSEESAAVDDLLAGERALVTAPAVAYPDDHYLIDPSKAAFFASGTMAALRRPKETIEHAAEVIRVSEDKRTRNYWPMRVANARVEWAMALADLGQEDEAMEQAMQALDPEWFRPDTERRVAALLLRLRDPRIRADLSGALAERLRGTTS